MTLRQSASADGDGGGDSAEFGGGENSRSWTGRAEWREKSEESVLSIDGAVMETVRRKAEGNADGVGIRRHCGISYKPRFHSKLIANAAVSSAPPLLTVVQSLGSALSLSASIPHRQSLNRVTCLPADVARLISSTSSISISISFVCRGVSPAAGV